MAKPKGLLCRKSRKGSAQANIWAAMRIIKRFRYADLEATADVKPKTVREYIRLLVKYGYLRREGTWQKPVFCLIKDTGPHAPALYYDTGLRDMNTGEIFTPEDTK